jgi:hypothetical protein
MTPGTGHHHLYLDADVSPMGVPVPTVPGSIVHMGNAASEYTFENVPAGQHRLIAVVADGVHVPLNPAVVDTIMFTVQYDRPQHVRSSSERPAAHRRRRPRCVPGRGSPRSEALERPRALHDDRVAAHFARHAPTRRGILHVDLQARPPAPLSDRGSRDTGTAHDLLGELAVRRLQVAVHVSSRRP